MAEEMKERKKMMYVETMVVSDATADISTDTKRGCL